MKRPAPLALAAALALGVAVPAMAQQASPGQQEVVPLDVNAGQISTLQRTLNRGGFHAGRVDGLWGPNTSAALRRFQAAHHVAQSGRLDAPTMALLGMPPANDAANAPAPAASPAPLPAAPATPPVATTIPATPPAAPANTATANPAGVAAASGDSNQAVATTSANAPQPAHGANSFSRGEATRRLEARGFQSVSNLRLDHDGVWRASATRNGQPVQAWLDYKGNVGQQ